MARHRATRLPRAAPQRQHSRGMSSVARSPGLHSTILVLGPATRAVGLALWTAATTASRAVAAPLPNILAESGHGGVDKDSGAPLWVLYVASAVLVLLGGAFAGLTIAFMGQDSIYLMVVSKDPVEPQRKNAKRVYDLLAKGKHWVLITLLLSNVIVNETLPVVLDRCLGGGVAAVVGSTILIVIFGEILPQSVCVRYGLQIGGYMSKPVLLLMYAMAPIAWPTAKLLDWLLGEDHGTVYKKSGLKTLVTLHKSLGDVSERLNQDEVTIISAVLDLKEKAVEDVMTPMDDVFTMSEDAVLDEKTMEMILSAGYSRIPIHEAGNPTNFVGMLLVKILITYDPEDCKRVRDFPLATLPETRPETSCLDIVNYFQEGKSHMVLVSEFPGENHGALGVVTLEDVIEELIGEEIIDESDVYIDVHKAIRRLAPAPGVRLQRRLTLEKEDGNGKRPAEENLMTFDEDGEQHEPSQRTGESAVTRTDSVPLGVSPKTATFIMRRSSAGGADGSSSSPVAVRAGIDELREHLKHLGPSNPATNPKNTRLSTVKIKSAGTPQGAPGGVGAVKPALSGQTSRGPTPASSTRDRSEETALLRPKMTGKGGTNAVRRSYGSMSGASDAQQKLAHTSGGGYNSHSNNVSAQSSERVDETPATATLEALASTAEQLQLPQQAVLIEIHEPEASQPQKATTADSGHDLGTQTAAPIALETNDGGNLEPHMQRMSSSTDSAPSSPAAHSAVHVGGGSGTGTPRRKGFVRTGSITENVIEAGGVRKVVLETASTSSNEDTSGEHHQRHGSRRHRSPRGSEMALLNEEGEDPTPTGKDAAVTSGDHDENADLASPGSIITATEGQTDSGSGPGFLDAATGAGPSTTAAGGDAGTSTAAKRKPNNRRKKRKGGNRS